MSDASGSRMPQSFGEKLSFSLPVILVTLVLSLGLGYVIVALTSNSLDKRLTAELDNARDELRKQVGEVTKKNEILDTQVATLTKENNEIKKVNTELEKRFNTDVEKVKVVSGEVRQNLEKLRTETEKTDTIHSKDIAENKDTINKVDTRLGYVEREMGKLKAIENDVKELKTDNKGLKEEYKILKADIAAVGQKADVTEKDLQDLGERAKSFQMRVLNARAREAVEAARASDLRQLLQRMEDVEGGK
jgi:chromosome segregation ATPase